MEGARADATLWGGKAAPNPTARGGLCISPGGGTDGLASMGASMVELKHGRPKDGADVVRHIRLVCCRGV
jgi:hypothetical protein